VKLGWENFSRRSVPGRGSTGADGPVASRENVPDGRRRKRDHRPGAAVISRLPGGTGTRLSAPPAAAATFVKRQPPWFR